MVFIEHFFSVSIRSLKDQRPFTFFVGWDERFHTFQWPFKGHFGPRCLLFSQALRWIFSSLSLAWIAFCWRTSSAKPMTPQGEVRGLCAKRKGIGQVGLSSFGHVRVRCMKPWWFKQPQGYSAPPQVDDGSPSGVLGSRPCGMASLKRLGFSLGGFPALVWTELLRLGRHCAVFSGWAFAAVPDFEAVWEMSEESHRSGRYSEGTWLSPHVIPQSWELERFSASPNRYLRRAQLLGTYRVLRTYGALAFKRANKMLFVSFGPQFLGSLKTLS